MLIPVILSGGAGTRLWPVSRKAHPKPFMRLADGNTLAGTTIQRALAVARDAATLTVTSRDHYFLTRDIYQEAAPKGTHHFLLEPEGRNTAPAIVAAAMWVQAHWGESAQMLVMPADHLIRDMDAFSQAVQSATKLAAEGWLTCLGVTPTHPETGYGYIRSGDGIESWGHKIDAFVEKPDLETAQRYLRSGEFLWNAGMFCFTAGAILRAVESQAPDIYQSMEVVWRDMQDSVSTLSKDPLGYPMELPGESFGLVRAESIDFAVMEKATKRAVVPMDCGWSDIGSWQAISDLYESDQSGNRIQGEVVLIDSRNTFVQGESRLIAIVGVDDLVIVDTQDAVLVARRDRAQEVKAVVDELKQTDHSTVTHHQTIHRPWGTYTVLEDSVNCRVRRLSIRPGGVLSLQVHHRHSEHWTVVKGEAAVRLGESEHRLSAGETIAIAIGVPHRLANTGDDSIEVIEVQTGDYLGEDDMERLEDYYGSH